MKYRFFKNDRPRFIVVLFPDGHTYNAEWRGCDPVIRYCGPWTAQEDSFLAGGQWAELTPQQAVEVLCPEGYHSWFPFPQALVTA